MTSRCQEALEKREHICFGISLFHSLFSLDYIQTLLSWGKKEFKKISLFIPDKPTLYTLMACGYDEKKAQKKLKKQANYTLNKVKKALSSEGLSEDILANWDVLNKNPNFIKHYNTVLSLFESNPSFHSACMAATTWVLQDKIENPSSESLNIAVKYFLAEIPLIAASNDIFNTTHSVFCYHKPFPFVEDLIEAEKTWGYGMNKGQGFGIVILDELKTQLSGSETGYWPELNVSPSESNLN